MQAFLQTPLAHSEPRANGDGSIEGDAAPLLEALLSPCLPEHFFAKHWRQRLLHLPKQASSMSFERLLPIQDIDRLFAASISSVDDWFFFRAEQNLGREHFVGAQGQIQLNSVFALYRDGGTIHLRNTQRYLPSIERFWRALTHRFRTQVRINLWVTRSNEFTPFLHYDTHDIFILQLHGRKQWTLYERNPALFAPRATDVSLDRRDVGESIRQITVGPGDLLYVPAGMPHEVVTVDSDSVHLAVGVFPVLWRDVLDAALADLDSRGSALSDAVPPELLAGDVEALGAALRERLLKAADEVRRESLGASLEQRFIDAMPPPDDGHFVRELLAPGAMAPIQAETLLRRRAGAPASVEVADAEGLARIRFPGGGAMEGPASLTNTLRAVASAPAAFNAQSLPEDFDLDSRKLLLGELLQRGLLERSIDEDATAYRLSAEGGTPKCL